MPKVFVSHAQGGERLLLGPQPSVARGARRWEHLAALYAASLEACGYRAVNLPRPEIYHTEAARRVLGVEPVDWHLAVKPVEHLRPFHGIRNVFVCDWPPLESMPGGSAFSDPIRMLQMADAVLCCTPFSADRLRSAGIDRVLTMPPAITGLVPERPADRPPGQRFLCAHSGQPGAVTQGFAQAAAQRPDLQLVLYDAEDASVSDDGAELDRLLGEADFFLSADPATGFNLPLVQATLAGVPVVPIETQPGPITADTVRDAVLAAAELDAPSRAQMAACARDSAERRFSPAAFAARLAELHRLLAA